MAFLGKPFQAVELYVLGLLAAGWAFGPLRHVTGGDLLGALTQGPAMMLKLNVMAHVQAAMNF